MEKSHLDAQLHKGSCFPGSHRLLVERVFTMTLVPFTLEVKQRMKTLLHLFATVDHHAVK